MAQSMRRLIVAAILAVVVMMFTSGAHLALAALNSTQTSNTLAFLKDFPGALKTLSWSGTDYCSFSGVSCDADGLVSVNLAGKGLSGYMPSMDSVSDSSQVMVVSIDLSNNPNIKGNFKSDWAALKYLTYLDLSSTGIYGNLPDAWNGMASIKTIKVKKALACRNLPNWNMTTLETVDLSNNNMKGTLVYSWAGMTNLKSVDLTGNGFCGCVPSTWVTSTVLTNAANAIGGNLVATNCATSNTCNSNSYTCPSAAAGPMQATVAVVAIFAAAVAVMGL